MIRFQWRSKWPQHCITLQMKIGCEKLQILLVSENRQFPKLSGLPLKLFQNTLEVNIFFYLQMRRILRKWH